MKDRGKIKFLLICAWFLKGIEGNLTGELCFRQVNFSMLLWKNSRRNLLLKHWVKKP